MSAPDAWRRQFPTASMLEVIDAVADLVADRVVERLAKPAAVVEQVGYSPREAAAYVGIGESTLRRLIESGEVAAGRFGDRLVIHRSELDRLMLGQEGAA